jgi:hypothetical protein
LQASQLAADWRAFAATPRNPIDSGNFGSFAPFAKTREDRLKTNDPRLSLEERYPGPGDRAAAVNRAATQPVQDRLPLADDAKGFAE